MTLTATPAPLAETFPIVGKQVVGVIGVLQSQTPTVIRRHYSIGAAVEQGLVRPWQMVGTTFYYLGRLVQGQASFDQLGGPLRTAQLSHAIAQAGYQAGPKVGDRVLGVTVALLTTIAFISVSVGIFNLLPIPVLDGGHLAFYAYEAIARRPLNAAVQAVSYRVGLALLLGLMLFATTNDLRHSSVFSFPRRTVLLSSRPTLMAGQMVLFADRSAPAHYRLLTGLAWLLATTALAPISAMAQSAPSTPPAATATPAPPVTTAPPPPTAQVVGAPAQTGVVQRILIQGNVRIEQETILSYLPIQPGDTIGRAQMDLGVKTLFKTDLFSDVSIDLNASGDLVVRVVENPIINQVVFEGNDNLKDDKLRDEVTVRPRGIFTRGKVQGDVQRIVELYRRSGRIGVTVTPEIVELPQKRVDLIFEINEGPKSGVLRINFLGNKLYSESDLRGVIQTKESRFYRFLSSDDNYDPDRIDYDQEKLRKYYRNHGFYDFRVVNAIAELAPDKNGFAITYTLDEGAKYKFGKLKVETDLKRLNGAVLAQLLPLRSGQMYEDDKIRAGDGCADLRGRRGRVRLRRRGAALFGQSEDPHRRRHLRDQGRPARLRRPDRHRRQHPDPRSCDPARNAGGRGRRLQSRAGRSFEEPDQGARILQGRRHQADPRQRPRPDGPAGQGHRTADRRVVVQRRLQLGRPPCA